MQQKIHTIRQAAFRHYSFLTLLLLGGIFAACSSDDAPADNNLSDIHQLPITVSTAADGDPTRATGSGHMTTIPAGTVFTSGSKVDIFLKEAGNVVSNTEAWRYDGSKPYYMLADGSGLFDWFKDTDRQQHTSLFWPTTGNSVYFYAWYPKGIVQNLNNDFDFTVQEEQGALDGDMTSDLILGMPMNGNAVKPTASSVPLYFEHRMARVSVRFANYVNNSTEKKTAVTNAINAAKVTLGSGDICLQSTVNPTTGAVTTKTDGTKGTVTLKTASLSAVSADNTTNTKHYCLIPPQKLTGKVITIYDTDGTTVLKTYSIPQTADNLDIDAMAGREYIIDLTVKK